MTPDYYCGGVIINDISAIIGNFPQRWNDRLNTNLDLFSGFNIFQTKILKFMENSIDNNYSFIIITNLENLYNEVTSNITNLEIYYFNYSYNNNNFSIKIPLTNCWKIPSVPINTNNNAFYTSLSGFYNRLDINSNIRFEDYILLSFEEYILYIRIINDNRQISVFNNNNSNNNSNMYDSIPTGYSSESSCELSIPMRLKLLISDIIFEEKDNMTDSAFKNILEQISTL